MYEKDGLRLEISPKWLDNECVVKNLDTGEVTTCRMYESEADVFIRYPIGNHKYIHISLDEVEWEG